MRGEETQIGDRNCGGRGRETRGGGKNKVEELSSNIREAGQSKYNFSRALPLLVGVPIWPSHSRMARRAIALIYIRKTHLEERATQGNIGSPSSD